jgi:hypothetical protein
MQVITMEQGADNLKREHGQVECARVAAGVTDRRQASYRPARMELRGLHLGNVFNLVSPDRHIVAAVRSTATVASWQ